MSGDAAALRPVNRYLYEAFRLTIIVIAKLAWRVEAIAPVAVPATGPVILAPTHRSLLDIPLMAFVTRRLCRFMAKRELWDNRRAGAFIGALGAFPVNRGAPDRAALAMAMVALSEGSPLVIFPEGTRLHGPQVGPVEDGVAYLAKKAGATIVPVGVAGTQNVLPGKRRFPRFPKIVLVIGAPITVEQATGRLDRNELQRITESLQTSLQAAFDDANARAEGSRAN